MINLSKRSYQKEILDNNDIPFADIKQNMKELNIVNTYLGGHSITIAGVKELIKKNDPGTPLCIGEMGCGGGDNLKAIHDFCTKEKIPAQFIGIDIKAECIAFASQQYPNLPAQWITADYKTTEFSGRKPDIIFSSLFCHHFPDAELVTMLQWMKKHAATGFFINDLHRHPLAWYSIKWMTGLFSRSYLVKNDAPLSVARGFTKQEWKQLFHAAGISNFSIKWKWAFRYLITYSND